MRLAFGLIAFSTARNKVRYLSYVARGFSIAYDRSKMIPFREFIPAVCTTNVLGINLQDSESFKLFLFRRREYRNDCIDESVRYARRASAHAHWRR